MRKLVAGLVIFFMMTVVFLPLVPIAKASSIPGGPGTPTIVFTFVPPYGSFENLKGQVLHVNPVDYKVAVYIKVLGGWWTKPYWSQPLTTINKNGSWSCYITTGGVDEKADTIIAYLVTNGYSPPLAYGGALPPGIEQNSVAKVEVTRSPESSQETNQGSLEIALDLTGKKIIVSVTKYPSGTKRVGFFIDNKLKKLDKKAPFSMKKKVGPGEHFLTVVAYGTNNEIITQKETKFTK